MDRRFFRHACAVCLVVFALHPLPAQAVKSVNSPNVSKDELKLEWKGAYDTDDERASQDGAQNYNLNVSYGLTEFWAMELEGEAAKSGLDDADMRFTNLEWKNKFQFTDSSDWLSSGLRLGYRRHMVAGPDRLQAKLLLSKDVGKVASTANLILTKEVGEDAHKIQGGFAWASRYKFQPWLEPGFEWYSEFGELAHPGKFKEQGHSAGPFFYGQITPALKYDVGYLFGVSDAAPDGEVKARLEYKWQF